MKQSKRSQKSEKEVNEPHPLEHVYKKAIDQAVNGKGMRHGGGSTPFTEQRWARLAKGPAGTQGLLFQAVKKLEEALEKDTQEDLERELLGAIVYVGMIYLKEMGHVK